MSRCPSPLVRSISLQTQANGQLQSELVHRSHSPQPLAVNAMQDVSLSPNSTHGFVKQAVYGDGPVTPPAQPAPAPSTPSSADHSPKLFGLPLKYVSLVTLALQNASLTIIMHYSRVSTPPDRTYSAGSAVLLNELLKGSISMLIALLNIGPEDRRSRSGSLASSPISSKSAATSDFTLRSKQILSAISPKSVNLLVRRFRRLGKEVFSPDCWKLSIPAILYVIQNNLQFVAASNLDVATFQVTYQMKILTTAAFSVLLLRKRLTTVKWLSLLGLAIGVGIVQIQTTSGSNPSSASHVHETSLMNPLKGFLAVAAACMTSGLAGVYFEMVLKGSQSDLWVRNVQLSLFSLLPALVPIVFSPSPPDVVPGWFPWHLFRNFGAWAWATVLIQVFGGLVTAVVIKYSDNIMKGFATSLSIVISSLASVALFDFAITAPFVVGSTVVLGATWFYNQPSPPPSNPSPTVADQGGVGLKSLGLRVGRSSGSADGLIAPRKSPGIVSSLKGMVSSRSNSPTETTGPFSGQQQQHLTSGVNGAPLYRSNSTTSLGVPSAPPSRTQSSAALLGMTEKEKR